MNHREIAALMAELAPVIHDYVADGLKGLGERIAAVEARAPIAGEHGADGSPGIDGKDGAPGRDGVDGKDGAPGPDGLAGAPGERGEAGPPGAPGERGEPGAPGIPGEAGLAGKDGAPGRDGVNGIDGKDGADGLNGKDGTAGLDGKDGTPGRDGRDASDLGVIKGIVQEQVEEVLSEAMKNFKWSTPDFGRTQVLEISGVRQEIITAVPLFSGDEIIWRAGAYRKGDMVQFGGSGWVAICDTTTKPETPNSDWRLAIKRGRDGREGKPGDRGLQGAKGDVGERGPPGYRG